MTHIYDCVCRMTYASGQVSRVQHDASTWDATHSYGMRRIHMGYDLCVRDMTHAPEECWRWERSE